MWILCGICLVVSFALSAYGQSDVRKPPSITKGPKREVIFRENEEVTLTCKAEGIPTTITYEWKKNDTEFSLNQPNIHRGSDGDITILKATQSDDGPYQCFATNQYGTALSTVAQIQMAFLDRTSQSNTIFNMIVQEGRPFVIQAARRSSFPTATYSWEITTSEVDPRPRQFQQSQRVLSACNGDLYVAFAQKEDDLGGSIYKSTVFNANMDVRSGGSYTRVNVTQGPSPEFAPNITYFSKSEEIALIGHDIELKCFFSGKPLPEITWSRPRNNLPPRRNRFSHYKTHLTISNISKSDEGDYVCTATNTIGTIDHTLNIRAEAEPIFRRESDGPRNVDVTEGDTVTFNCLAFAIPEATVIWFRNGQTIDVKNGPKGYVFSDDGKSLTIRDVCRDCDDREKPTDLAVIQCKASNVHGHAFASGYLNVLLRTKVTLRPSSTFVSVDLTKENRFQFECSATSDPSTPPTVQWYKVVDQGQELVYDDLPYVYVKDGNLTIYTTLNCSATCDKYLGEYRCVGDNKYTQDNATVTLNGTRESITEPPLSATLNWIIIGIAIAMFLLLLILICCIICYLRKGEEYDVDGKERKCGRIPEDEIMTYDFQEYYPCEYGKRKDSGASLGSVDTFKAMMADINEYDDDDRNFGEDGSFVGKYTEKPGYD